MYYRLSRFSATHNFIRKAGYAILWRMPYGLKYGAGALWRRFRLPYRIVRLGDTVIQVGAPWDTLRAGRSRAAHFGRLVGNEGRVLVVEPTDENIEALRSFARDHSLGCMDVVPKGAWSTATRLRFLVNPEHPASNLVEDVCDETERDRSQYQVTEIVVDSIDNIAAQRGLGTIRLLSVTTNGAELEILKGAHRTLARIEYVSVITREAEELLAPHGYVLVGHDDRGYTYRRS